MNKKTTVKKKLFESFEEEDSPEKPKINNFKTKKVHVNLDFTIKKEKEKEKIGEDD